YTTLFRSSGSERCNSCKRGSSESRRRGKSPGLRRRSGSVSLPRGLLCAKPRVAYLSWTGISIRCRHSLSGRDDGFLGRHHDQFTNAIAMGPPIINESRGINKELLI